jgi:hypothetical protein
MVGEFKEFAVAQMSTVAEMHKEHATATVAMHQEMNSRDMMILEISNQLETAQEEGSIKREIARAFLEDPEKIGALVDMGIQNAAKAIGLIKTVGGSLRSSENQEATGT